jgi:hypothetical protein
MNSGEPMTGIERRFRKAAGMVMVVRLRGS